MIAETPGRNAGRFSLTVDNSGMGDRDAFLAGINASLADMAPRLVYSDWLEERGEIGEAMAWRGKKHRNLHRLYWYGDGSGSESGYWNGNGSGYWSGYGSGYGSGDGDGYGDGCGYGDGDESGYGDGVTRDGYGGERLEFETTKLTIINGWPMIGKRMLIWCGSGFAWIGVVAEMYAPGAYKLTNGGMLCRTGGDSWMSIADGTARDRYVYRHAPGGVVFTGAEIHGAVEWVGELPGKDVR